MIGRQAGPSIFHRQDIGAEQNGEALGALALTSVLHSVHDKRKAVLPLFSLNGHIMLVSHVGELATRTVICWVLNGHQNMQGRSNLERAWGLVP